MARKPAPSLDHTGTQAAVYPSEQTLWTVGPPITDPADPIVYLDENLQPPPPGPRNPAAEEAWINETLNGETPNGAVWENVVNNAVYGPQGFGDWNVQAFETGHTQNRPSDPSSEQGWGVGPARRWAHYPKTDSPNPARNEGQHLRNGELPWVSVETALYYRTQLEREQSWGPYKARSPVAPVVQVPVSVPFVQTVPTFSGGPVDYPGIDVPPEAGGVWPS
jgi:hypothetical protein